jgi:hypothetical protein
MLALKVNGVSKAVRDEFLKHNPPIVKLTMRGYDEKTPDTHTNYILDSIK